METIFQMRHDAESMEDALALYVTHHANVILGGQVKIVVMKQCQQLLNHNLMSNTRLALSQIGLQLKFN